MANLLAQDDPGFSDNLVLDQWRIPFGDWVKEIVFWTDQNMEPLLDGIRAPFAWLFDVLVEGDNSITGLSWVVVMVVMFIIATLMRNARVGVFVVLALTVCGLLGADYWFETTKTIGMIFVAVVLCALIGVPLGIACGRFDGVWNVVRPALDAMQVVHSFVYMLPIIFFFGIGEVPATMVTMVFAIPPLIRLTNLGIRQVPEDVVEASRAFGAPEYRVLTDVQLPLARPAIMTGLNQTLLLSISMLGIAALMGAGGLGLLVFRAINNLSVDLAASAGLALFLVAVVLDRISQREEDDGQPFLARLHQAWAARHAPEVLLESGVVAEETVAAPVDARMPIGPQERSGLLLGAVGGVVLFSSLFLTWSTDAGWLSSYARRADEAMPGGSFNGFSASGGSWFGISIAMLAVLAVAAVVNTLLRPGQGPKRLSTETVALAGLAALVPAAGFLLSSGSPLAPDASQGPGPLLATVAAAVTAVGGAIATFSAPYGPRRPLPAGVSMGRIFGLVMATLVVAVGLSSSWVNDARADVIVNPEIEAEIDRLEAEAEANPALAPQNAQEISNLFNEARKSDALILNAYDNGGPGFAPFLWAVAAVTVLLGLLGSGGVPGQAGEQRRWFWNVLVGGLALGMMTMTLSWVGTMARVAQGTDAKALSGAGCLLTLIGSFLYFATSRGLLAEFRRRKLYASSADDLVGGVDVTRDLSETEGAPGSTLQSA